MKQAGGDDLVWLPVREQQRTDLDWMGDERCVVDLPVLIRVAGRGERERGPCDWQSARTSRWRDATTRRRCPRPLDFEPDDCESK